MFINWFNWIANLFYLIGEREYWGRGLASKSVNLIPDYGFKELNLHKIYGEVMSPNLASHRVLEKLGFYIRGHF